jgi:hypothetical protein
MNVTSTTGAAKARVPLLVLHSAYRLARLRGDGALADGIAQAFEAGRQPRLDERFMKVVDARGVQDVLPFVRDRVDVLAACSMLGVEKGMELRLFSDCSFVEAGYLSVTRKQVCYVDRARRITTESDKFQELLPTQALARLLAALRGLDEHPASVVVPDDPAHLLEVHADMPETNAGKLEVVSLALVRPDRHAAAGVVVRRLGSARVAVRSAGCWAISLSANATLEVHAAALAGHWLELASPEQRLLSPLPDFSRVGAKVDAWLQPRISFAKAAGRDVEQLLAVPREIARELCQRHRWCFPLELDVCLEALQEHDHGAA